MLQNNLVIPNTIRLISPAGRLDEGAITAGQIIWPGMLIRRMPDGTWSPHTEYGGVGPVAIAVEDANRGLDITQPMIGPGTFPFYYPVKGDMFLCLLQNGQKATTSGLLISAGDGTLAPDPGQALYTITAPSTIITNTNTETVFSNGTYTVAANALFVNDTLRVSGQVNILSQNATDTNTIKVYVGAANVVLNFGALSLPAGSVVNFDLQFRFSAVGASGSFTGNGTYWYTVGANTSPISAQLALTATTLATNATFVVKVSDTMSAASTADQAQLQSFRVSVDRSQYYSDLFTAYETVDNSGSPAIGVSGFNNAAFLRTICI